MDKFYCDVLIIGSGVAALQTAIHASDKKNVTLVTKTQLRNSNTYLAQGGVAVAHAPYDQIKIHIEDTIEAGNMHNDRQSVSSLVKEGVVVINELLEKGMPFDRDENNQLMYGLEGAHSKRRILHSHGDATGKQLIEFLLKELKKTNVEVYENEFVMQLLLSENGKCVGAATKDASGKLKIHYASHIVLATGGCGHLYPFSTNGANATGDGYALALKAGAELIDMEFVQFHPTGLYIDGKIKGLVSEAVRGEGAKLVTEQGERIMKGIHPLEDLAPRHIVAEKINEFLLNDQLIYLDIRMISQFSKKFPTITRLCEANGCEWKKGFIPVAPASHFMMGGIRTDLNCKTTVNQLYAVGEVACTGVHGANRLASNSLLEGLVFGKKLGCYLKNQRDRLPDFQMKRATVQLNRYIPEIIDLQEKMLRSVGVIREEKGLRNFADWLKQFSLQDLLNHDWTLFKKKEATAVFMTITAMSIVNAALLRQETRGAHIRSDFAHENQQLQKAFTVIHSTKIEGRIVYEQVKA